MIVIFYHLFSFAIISIEFQLAESEEMKKNAQNNMLINYDGW